MYKSLLFYLLIGTLSPLTAQVISGSVFDARSGVALAGVSVYFDGSTTGILTDDQGAFQLQSPMYTQAPLIFSHMGYSPHRIGFPYPAEEIRVFLKEDTWRIPEVVVTSDPFSRRQKLEVFKKEFLGDARPARYCTILNEEVIRLFFNSHTNTLTASAKAPLVIVNDYLKYRVQFDLREFKIDFRSRSLDRIDNIEQTRYAGFTRFEDYSDNESRILKRRQKAYLGSSMHFMRSLRKGKLTEENYTFKHELKSLMPGQLFAVGKDSAGLRTFTVLKERIAIYYQDKSFFRSTFRAPTSMSFSVDPYGTYTPYEEIIFGGYMADQRISELVPTDYTLRRS